MGRKVFISVLGTGFYYEGIYQKEGCAPSSSTRFIQQATLESLGAVNWEQDSLALILLTKGAYEQNWNEKITSRTNFKGETIPYIGLQKVLKDMHLPFAVEELPIPDGKNQTEMWQIFNKLYDALKEGDQLYFDLTHSFRYIPMLLLVLSSYSKFLKNVTIEGIMYGNHEMKDKNGISPIIDLLPLSTLQDWTFAAGQFVENGSVENLKNLSRKEFSPILRDTQGQDIEASNIKGFVDNLEAVVEDFNTCRGMSFVKSDRLSKLKLSVEKLESTFIEPLNPIIEKIKDSLNDFNVEEDVMNALSAAKWCFENKLYQQSATILQEFVVTFYCKRNGIPIDDENKREVINQAFILKAYNAEEETPENWHRIKEENKPYLRKVLSDELFSKEMTDFFQNLTEVRNDYNHSGMRSSRLPMKPSKIKENIRKCLEGISLLLKQNATQANNDK